MSGGTSKPSVLLGRASGLLSILGWVLFLAQSVLSQCPTSPVPDGCEVGLTCCSGHGTCQTINVTASQCVCDAGFFPLDTCLVFLDCGPEFLCNGQGTCNEPNAECDCTAPWLQPSCNITQCDVDELDCGSNGQCSPEADCDCDPGFAGATCEDAVPLPTPAPTLVPTLAPTAAPTDVPTLVPGQTLAPTALPTAVPTPVPSAPPTAGPTPAPTAVPTEQPFIDDPVCGTDVACGQCYHHPLLGEHVHGCCCSEDVNQISFFLREDACENITEFCGIILDSSAAAAVDAHAVRLTSIMCFVAVYAFRSMMLDL